MMSYIRSSCCQPCDQHSQHIARARVDDAAPCWLCFTAIRTLRRAGKAVVIVGGRSNTPATDQHAWLT